MTTRVLAFAFACLVLGACTSTSGLDDQDADDLFGGSEIGDPIEPTNRKLFSVHQTVDKTVVRPVAKGYGRIPGAVRRGVSNAISNLGEPFSVANQVLQADMDGALGGTKRFFINSTIGILGVMDIAESRFKIEEDKEDFGQTLAVWGVPEGTYLVLPGLGPTTIRHLTGRIAGAFLDPANIVLGGTGATAAMAALKAVDTRQKLLKPLDDLERTSMDYYAALRSVYWQRRNAAIQR
jgi:phospholipid-binding lipoprotein MlaA